MHRPGLYNERDGLSYGERLLKESENKLQYFVRTASEEEDEEDEKREESAGSALSVIMVVAHSHLVFF